MENFNEGLKKLGKNKIYLIVIGLAVFIFAAVLIYAYTDFSGTKISFVPIEKEKPYCDAIGSKSEGWYVNSNFNRPKLIKWDNCDGCEAICQAIGSRSEGWYSSCNGKLIKYDNCGEAQEQKCGIENCHGLNITCGSNIPDMCTEIYMIGDGCRQYAKCEIIDGKCQLVKNEKFEACKSCVEKCSEDFENDPIELSQCAYKCAESGEEDCYSDKDCDGNQFCEFPKGECKEPGKCIKKSEFCTMIYAPVCGCDSKTYSNDCMRQSAGVSKKHNGKCGEKKQTCNEKCKSLNYTSGICRTWPIVPDAEWGCKENEKNIGKTSDCTLIRTVGEIDEVIVGVGKTCCCQGKISENCTKEGEKNYFGKPSCCEDLVSISDARLVGGKCFPSPPCGGGYCTKCGDGICKSPENKCNCPEDCKEDEKYNLDEYYSNIDYSCNADSDCEIKDVHNCCGYYPKCVNKNAKTDPDYVKKACAAEQIESVCGFPCIDNCRCVQNKCEGILEEKEKLSADLNCDDRVGPADFAILLGNWRQDPSGFSSCQSPDINKDGNVDPADFAVMMGQWKTDRGTNHKIINCNEDYDCLYQQISIGNSAKIIITEEIESLSLIEKSEVKVELINNKYQVSMKVLDLKEIKKEKFSVRSIVGSISKTCPQIINNLDKVKSKSATCVVDSAKEAKQLAIDGLTESAIKNYNCKGGLIDVINEICVTPDFPHFPPGVRKPAVYLYPKEKSKIEVNLSINGFITKSEPDYLLGWNVMAEPDGLINNEYDYLFYEAQLNNIELPNEGWVVEYSNLENWFDKNLPQLGLNQKEISHFKGYWLNELKKSNYYEIKLLDEIFLTENMNLIINPQPDTIIRRNFYFKPLNEKITLTEPIISTPERIGFTAVEWGGLLDK